MIREARIILYSIDWRGMPVDHTVQPWLESELLALCGGFTRTNGEGAWRDEKGRTHWEQVGVYDLAMPDSGSQGYARPDPVVVLQTIAVELKRRARQKSVYLRHPDGCVEFI